MSQWTHVVGHIQLNCFEVHNPHAYMNEYENVVKKAFGEVTENKFVIGDREYIDFSSDAVPGGSEGCLRYDVKRTGYMDETGGGLDWGYITVWENLRDYNDVEEIYQWIKTSCKKLYVRMCAILIDVKYKGTWLIFNNIDGELILKQIEKYNEET